jgi:hypothetical protein
MEGSCEQDNEMLGSSSLAAQLAATQEGLSSMSDRPSYASGSLSPGFRRLIPGSVMGDRVKFVVSKWHWSKFSLSTSIFPYKLSFHQFFLLLCYKEPTNGPIEAAVPRDSFLPHSVGRQ